jgi:DNA repair exonuclease SbcCD ATPase subunit
MKKLQTKIKKGDATASNLKKKIKQDSQALQAYIKQIRDANAEIDSLKQEAEQAKALQDNTKALEDEIKALKRDPQRQPKSEPEPAPILEPEQEDPSPVSELARP